MKMKTTDDVPSKDQDGDIMAEDQKPQDDKTVKTEHVDEVNADKSLDDENESKAKYRVGYIGDDFSKFDTGISRNDVADKVTPALLESANAENMLRDRDDGPIFTNDKTAQKTHILSRKRDERYSTARQRLEEEGWNFGIPFHAVPGGFHSGLQPSCKNCDRPNMTQKDPNNGKRIRRFIELSDLSDVKKYWRKAPNKLGIAYMAYYEEQPTVSTYPLHMTVYYVPCGEVLATTMYLFGKKVAKLFPTLDLKVIGPHPTIRDAYEVSVKLDRDTRTALNRIGIRTWKPHVTSKVELEPGKILRTEPRVQIITEASTPDDVYSVQHGVTSFAERLKLDVSEFTGKEDVQQKQKTDSKRFVKDERPEESGTTESRSESRSIETGQIREDT